MSRPAGRVAIVTDSTACLPPEVIRTCRVIVVPLRLLAGDLIADDGQPGSAAGIELAAARGERLTTARPPPASFEAAYRQAALAGAPAVVSVHVSAVLSGTFSSAQLAASTAPVPVELVDTRSIGMGVGLPVLAACAAARAGRSAADVAAAATTSARQARSFFALDSAAVLLAGGRIADDPDVSSQHAAGPGSPLRSRPVTEIRDGRLVPVERVRTRSAAAELLVRLAVAAAREGPVDLAVQHTAAPDRAAALAEQLAAAVPQVGTLYLAEAGTAIRIHTGLGMLGVTLAPSASRR